ncbi:tRNA preQ1(34) S-adenosylmethionine ribosyltransferase-isomerase QueA [Thermoanaerobacterium thermosaccharolyticum]|jgi:S-adenosylmethionine:tRNA ribosyltransferase-isomerase|uniref:S-adenosylmethionine:tRNA ribosyltransferase-isomerase n=2 Tax=Thermoanaerobacterium thermosaccharolyticum TaxID=1517 RepID=D9TP93_THETC|nr:tRNA preQ1(34) S-adenosylmethionine ribosyltransferase-isomerase QueA [Thermoanaerobacterium thermosaccharolyticum]ADL69073.1 S-adenosylmethionine/tRNA-ribosyltransferase-isomerase [Thermoanaerobacterium thermosaccharolyticum DSM 571]AST58882.1 S-adenosylmethionine tRNA ribosyltransferase [Thermoanaerobacterium thermosaccharolyticum]KAA5807136.1 tRNA preQ1(34) S-adenosylmethionine ribosyltransferase-isomerase QueA [Thermoanaerobacterium thermosaccharolyticum]PHO06979.1 tRNA preQ1(34) S-adeno
MNLHEFYYDLPEELIAQEPLKNRDESRLMILNRLTGEIKHDIFKNIISYLNPNDVLVLNDTKVIPARLIGVREDTGGKIEFVLLKRLSSDEWEILVKPGRRAKIGSKFIFGNGELKAEVISNTDVGGRIVRFSYEGIFEEVLDKLGEMPVPPYIKKKLEDKNMYQTVYAKHEGSAAAPTAGLHFTNKLLDDIRKYGVKTVFVTLHVGLGTFRPVKEEVIEKHKMHSEFYTVTEEAAQAINTARESGGRIISVGTTSTRTLETVADENGIIHAGSGWTDIFIYPGYKYKAIDGIITNFHLPESTLIMMISAFAGKENVMNAYKTAIDNKYRFYSFGDAMLII